MLRSGQELSFSGQSESVRIRREKVISVRNSCLMSVSVVEGFLSPIAPTILLLETFDPTLLENCVLQFIHRTRFAWRGLGHGSEIRLTGNLKRYVEAMQEPQRPTHSPLPVRLSGDRHLLLRLPFGCPSPLLSSLRFQRLDPFHQLFADLLVDPAELGSVFRSERLGLLVS